MSQTKGTRHQLSAFQTSNSSGTEWTRTINLVFAKHLHSHCATAPFVQPDNLTSMQTVSSRELPVTSPWYVRLATPRGTVPLDVDCSFIIT